MLRRAFIVLAFAVAATALASDRDRLATLPEQWRRWLEDEVYPLISTEERKVFLALETDEQRTEFADRLWAVWGTQLGRGAQFRLEYQERLEYCRSEFKSTTEDRARVALLHGPPDVRKPVDCEEVFYPLEFWRYARLEGIGESVTLLFYRPYGLGRMRLWDPFETRLALYTPSGRSALSRPRISRVERPEYRCGDAEELLALLASAEYWLRDPQVRSRMEHLPEPAKGGAESASARFLQFSTVVPRGAQPLEFTVEQRIGERRGGKVRVTFAVLVPRANLVSTKVGDIEVVQVDCAGETSQEGTLADRFRYSFTFPAESETLPLQVERELRPGKYKLRLKVQDGHSNRAGVQEAEFDVPMPTVAGSPGAQAAEEVVKTLAAPQQTALALQGPEGEGVSGVQRFTALAGPGVARVEFFLDGRSIMAKNRPPFEVELDLGPLPRLASVVAVASDITGAEVDRKQIDLNVGRERFLVRLQPIGQGDRSGDKVHAVATANVPPDRKLARLEVYWNETLAATVFEPPFSVWVPVGAGNALGYLRAVAVLDDGAQAEDVQFVNAPQFLSQVEVDAVELPVVVLDKEGKPIEGLKLTDFEVLEDGVVQNVSNFALQLDLPVRVGMVLDTSGSMEKTLPEVQRVVLGFLRNLLRPRDRAFVVAFSDRPELLEGFTADFAALERALISLRADRETALYDAVVYSLFQFSGVRGRKSLIALTDGKDNVSRMDFEKMMDYAQRTGAVIYSIGIDLPITEVRTRSQLSRLARGTGGEAFFLPRGASLEPIYERINRELRAQYLLAYTSSSPGGRGVFRKVAVRVKRPGAEVRTIAGYYPGG